MSEETAKATFAFGSFWGAEAWFRNRMGVLATRVGYIGGSTANPTPEQVMTNTTGHAEAVEVTVDARQWPYSRLLQIFWSAHDPTLVPRHGPARGHRFRSEIFFHSAEQEREALESVAAQQASYGEPLTTEVKPATTFWPAPDGDQQKIEVPDGQRLLAQIGGVLAGRRSVELSRDDRDRNDAWLIEFGPVFTGRCSPTAIRQLLVDDEGHLAQVLNQVRQTLALERGGLLRATTSLDIAPATTTVMVAGLAAQLRFVANLQPGNFRPRLGLYGSVARNEPHPNPVVPEADDFRGGSSLGGGVQSVDPPRAPASQPVESDDGAGQWWEHIPDAIVEFDCGGLSHPLRWTKGKLELLSEVVALERERALTVLGARPICLCLAMMDAWNPRWASAAWLQHWVSRFSEELFAHPAGRPPFGVSADEGRQPQGEVSPPISLEDAPQSLPDPASVSGLASRPLTREEMQVALHVQKLLMVLPDGFTTRWLLGGMASLEARRADLDRYDRLLLEGGLFSAVWGAARGTLWQWCREDPAISYGAFNFRYLERGEAADAEGAIEEETANVAIAVPFRWLTHVWARGLASIDGQLVLDVEGPADADTLAVRAATWQERGSGSARLAGYETRAHWDGDVWHLSSTR